MKKLNKWYWNYILVSLLNGILIALVLIGFTILINFIKIQRILWRPSSKMIEYGIYSYLILELILLIYFIIFRKKNKTKSEKLSKWSSQKKEFNNTNIEIKKKSGFIVETTKKLKKVMIKVVSEDKDGHALLVGSTGSGKTALIYNPQIYSFANSLDKPSIVVSDPKGELFNVHSRNLSTKGYEIISINLRDWKKSHNWNPIEKIWDIWFKKIDEDLNEALKEETKEDNKEIAKQELKKIANIIYDTSRDSGNKFWKQAAGTMFEFVALRIIEEAENDKTITKSHFNITNISYILQSTSFEDMQEYVDEINMNSEAIAVGGSNIRGAEATVNGIKQTAVTEIGIYNSLNIKMITSKTNWKFDDSKPQAIFLIVPDEETTMYSFITLFIADLYKNQVEIAYTNENQKLKRKIYYILDEFGNIPKIPNFNSMITVSRSRNIFFMIAIQAYSQLREKYGINAEKTIIGNCNIEYFLMTNEFETAVKFANKLGKEKVESKIENLLSPQQLMNLKFGTCYIKISRSYPFKTKFIKFWEYQKFNETKGSINIENNISGSYKKKHIKNIINNVEIDFNSIKDNINFNDIENPIFKAIKKKKKE